mmetsp:Transcript_74233/g.120577  ORF Transcript_74233/g.120577 Transcript_74233/m.120577 type:complete len:217 (-) Transcript_74233:1056-1706(-)
MLQPRQASRDKSVSLEHMREMRRIATSLICVHLPSRSCTRCGCAMTSSVTPCEPSMSHELKLSFRMLGKASGSDMAASAASSIRMHPSKLRAVRLLHLCAMPRIARLVTLIQLTSDSSWMLLQTRPIVIIGTSSMLKQPFALPTRKLGHVWATSFMMDPVMFGLSLMSRVSTLVINLPRYTADLFVTRGNDRSDMCTRCVHASKTFLRGSSSMPVQ